VALSLPGGPSATTEDQLEAVAAPVAAPGQEAAVAATEMLQAGAVYSNLISLFIV
jgi:hypothetical protein